MFTMHMLCGGAKDLAVHLHAPTKGLPNLAPSLFLGEQARVRFVMNPLPPTLAAAAHCAHWCQWPWPGATDAAPYGAHYNQTVCRQFPQAAPPPPLTRSDTALRG